MENKKDLAQIALAALILASAIPVNGQAGIEAHGIFLAAGCAAHGCPGVKNDSSAESAMNDNNAYYTPPSQSSGNDYNAQPYGTKNRPPVGTPSRGSPDSPNMYHNGAGSPPPGYRGAPSDGSTNPAGKDNSFGNASSRGSYGNNPGYYISDVYSPSSGYDAQQAGNAAHRSAANGGMSNYNRDDNTTTDYNNNRSAVTNANSSATLTEPQLLILLNAQGRAIYLSLNPEGKALAIQLASQDSYRDKNLAVKEAQRRMNERRG